jgi:multidrug efflux pump subunit AcrB
MSMTEALIQGGTARFRPVVLTALTTILGLVPMAIGVSIDFSKLTITSGSQSTQIWAGMAIAVVFGLAFATVLTLVMVPTMYSIAEDVRALRARIFGRGVKPERASVASVNDGTEAEAQEG